MLQLGCNRLLQDELALMYDGVLHEWRRVLFYNRNGRAVEIALTPSQPQFKDNWREVERMVVRVHSTFSLYGDKPTRMGDAFWRYIQRNRHSIIYDALRRDMTRFLPNDVVQHLLCWDFMPQIDWDAYMANQSNGGCAFALCKRRRRL